MSLRVEVLKRMHKGSAGAAAAAQEETPIELLEKFYANLNKKSFQENLETATNIVNALLESRNFLPTLPMELRLLNPNSFNERRSSLSFQLDRSWGSKTKDLWVDLPNKDGTDPLPQIKLSNDYQFANFHTPSKCLATTAIHELISRAPAIFNSRVPNIPLKPIAKSEEEAIKFSAKVFLAPCPGKEVNIQLWTNTDLTPALILTVDPRGFLSVNFTDGSLDENIYSFAIASKEAEAIFKAADYSEIITQIKTGTYKLQNTFIVIKIPLKDTQSSEEPLRGSFALGGMSPLIKAASSPLRERSYERDLTKETLVSFIKVIPANSTDTMHTPHVLIEAILTHLISFSSETAIKLVSAAIIPALEKEMPIPAGALRA